MNKSPINKPLSKYKKKTRSFIKRFIYSQLSVYTGLKIAIGREQPFIRFTVEKDPPSVYWVFRIKDSMVDSMATSLGLPSEFSISPVQCLESDKPDFLLVLNSYRVSGLTNSIRAEWSIFVQDRTKKTHFMIVDARSAKGSMDPINIITKPSTVQHERIENTIFTQVGDGEDSFKSTITIQENATTANISTQWITANDYIYWLNGIRDHTFYNGGLVNAKQLVLDSNQNLIENNTNWGMMVDPDPVHILMLENEIEFVISPWENIDILPGV